jgi:uncharacterized RDD family membrane protein YckC
MEHEHLTDLKTGKPKLKVSCPQCGKVLDNQVEKCQNCKNPDLTKEQSSLESITPSSSSASAFVSPRASTWLPQPDSATIAIAQPASFKKRFFATIIDEIIIGPIAFLVCLSGLIPIGQYFMIGRDVTLTFNSYGYHFAGAVLVVILGNTIPYLYVAMFEASKLAATPGKFMMGLKVVSNENSTITIKDGISKTLTQSLFYVPILILISLPILISMGFVVNKSAINFNQTLLDLLSQILSLLIATVITAVLSYPCFRKSTQSFMDLICNRFVVERHAPLTVSPPPLRAVESKLHKLHHLTAVVFWLPAGLIILAVPTLIFCAFSNLLSDFWLGIGLLLLSWIASIWILCKFRKTAGPIIAKTACAIICAGIILGTLMMLPEYITRISNTPKALQLIDQALTANKKGDTKSYEEFRLKARALPSYAVSYYALRISVYEKILGIPLNTYTAPRMWAITSGPGTPAKKYPKSK